MICTKIFEDSWLCIIPVISQSNRSFGKTNILQLQESLIRVKTNNIQHPIDKWISETGFLKGFPIEFLYLKHSEFLNILSCYNSDILIFLENKTFYLWYNPN